MKIGIDLDWTLIKPVITFWDLVSQICYLHTGELTHISPPSNYGLQEYDGAVLSIMKRIFNHPMYMIDLQRPRTSAFNLLYYLSWDNHIKIITARSNNNNLRIKTKWMLQKFFHDPLVELIFVNSINSKKDELKSVDVWIDDNPNDCYFTAHEMKIPTFLINDLPWSDSVKFGKHDTITKCKLIDVLKLINDGKKKY